MLRAIAVAVAIQGARSSFELAIGTRLSMQMTLEWWDFESSVIGFFVHCVAIAGLYIVLSYYAAMAMRHSMHAATIEPSSEIASAAATKR